MRVLIVGGDSVVGSALADHLAAQRISVISTTRRADRVSPSRPFLDLEQAIANAYWPNLPETDVWIFCAAITKLEQCRMDPEAARQINVEAPSSMIDAMLSANAHCVFLSSNQVFDGEAVMPGTGAPISPKSVYGKQKVEAESHLMASGKRIAIVRITKILHAGWELIVQWCEALQRGDKIVAFADQVFAPVAITSINTFLANLVTEKQVGTFHLSGPYDISYYDAARHLAKRLNASAAQVQRGWASEAGIPPEECPLHTALDVGDWPARWQVALPNPERVLDMVYGLTS